jgi:hypothetical protein
MDCCIYRQIGIRACRTRLMYCVRRVAAIVVNVLWIRREQMFCLPVLTGGKAVVASRVLLTHDWD